MDNEKQKGSIYYIYVILGGICWGAIGLFSGVLNQTSLLPTDLVAIRSVGAAIVFSIIYLIKDKSIFKVKGKDLKYFFGTGIVSFILMNWCYFNAMQKSSISVAAILLYTGPTFVVIMSAILFHEKITGMKVLALIMTFSGCCLVAGVFDGNGTSSSLGIVFGVLSGFFYALYTIFGKFALRKYNSYTLTLYTFFFAAVGSLFLVNPNHITTEFRKPDVLLCAVGLSVVSTVAAFYFYSKGLQGIDSGRASILATVEPVIATLFSVFVWGETLSVLRVLGIAIIIVAVVLLSLNVNSGKTAIPEISEETRDPEQSWSKELFQHSQTIHKEDEK